MRMLEVEVQFKEDEHVVLNVLEVEVEEEEKEQQVIWGCWRLRRKFSEDDHVDVECVGGRVGGGREGRTVDLAVLEVEVEFKEDEHVVLNVLEVEVEFKEEEEEEQVIWGCWSSRCSSRRMNMWF